MATSRQEDTSIMFKDLEFTYDRNATLTIREFFDKYKTNLPQLVIITEGYDGPDMCEYMCTDQVFRVHTIAEQPRVIAEKEGECFSIPVQTDFKYVLQSDTENNPKTLTTILVENKDFPITVREVFNGTKTLTIQAEYNEIYLAGNCIHAGVPIPDPVFTALSSSMKCAVVTGIEGRPQDEFRKKLNTYSEFVSGNNIKFDCKDSRKDAFRFQTSSLRSSPNVEMLLRDSAYCTMMSSEHLKSSTETYEQILVGPEMDNTRVSSVQSPDRTESVRDRCQGNRTFEGSDRRKDDWQGRRPLQIPPMLPDRVNSPDLDIKQTRSEDNEIKVPKHLELLTVSVIGDCLEQLGLKRYVRKFSKKRINGRILAFFNDDGLISEFHLKPSEVIRIRQFITIGHIPK